MIKIKEGDLLQCCGSTAWAKQMAAHSFPNVKEIFATGDSIWWSLAPADWNEAFALHTKSVERASRQHASEHTLAELATASHEYQTRFGYPFVICGSSKSPHSILEALRARLAHNPDEEIRIAADEQRQITHQRLKRLLEFHK